MKAVLACPGPSLAAAKLPVADLVVGVNRAATFIPCDIWVCGDIPLVQQIHEKVLCDPVLITSTDACHVCRTFKRDFGRELWRGEFKCWTEALSFCPHEYQWVMFSATAALIWCAFSGAKRIEVYGADWKGVEDFDGEKAGANRSDERWKLERQIWANLVNWLKDRGVEAERMNGNV
jgi:hypothetical protein